MKKETNQSVSNPLLTMFGMGYRTHTVFKPEIKDEKCSHDWKTLKYSSEQGGFLSSSSKLEFEYLFCPNCGSTTGDEVTIRR